MPLLLADVSLDPTKVAEKLGKAQDVQQVLAWVVVALVLALVFFVWTYLKREKEHEAARVEAEGRHRGDLQRANERTDKAYDDAKEIYAEVGSMLAGKVKE